MLGETPDINVKYGNFGRHFFHLLTLCCWLAFYFSFFVGTLLLAGTSLVKNKVNFTELCSFIVKDKDIVFFTLDKESPQYLFNYFDFAPAK